MSSPTLSLSLTFAAAALFAMLLPFVRRARPAPVAVEATSPSGQRRSRQWTA